MNFQLITESPAWMLVLCPVAGLLYAWVLYRKETTFSAASAWLTRLMAAFRFLTVSVLVLLLLSPLIRTVFSQVEKPLIIFLQDRSQSILSVRDSTEMKTAYPEKVEALKQQLGEDFDVRTFSIGDGVSDGLQFDFAGGISDLSQPVDELKSRFSGRNLGAVILATDGIYNKGSNPLYSFPSLKVPVFTIGMGDTTVRKDVLIGKISHNKTAYTGNTFPVEVTIDARQCAGQEVTLTISKNDEVVHSKIIPITSARYNMLLPVFLEAREKGVQHYTARITTLEGEVSHLNNKRDFFIEVIDSRQQILLLAGSPHPDIAVLKTLLELNPNYEVKAVLMNEFDGKIGSVNMAILHQMPSLNFPARELIQQLRQQQIPVFYILGSQSQVQAFNQTETGVSITDHNGGTTEIMAEPVSDFPFFTMEEEHLRRIRNFPPLISPFGNYNVRGPVQPLLNQRVGNVKTGMPLLFFSFAGEQKIAVLAGEGIWKWRLREYADFNTAESVTAVLTKTVQYLASRDKKSPFRIYYKISYNENEPVKLDAEFYNESGELVNDSEARIAITDSKGNQYPFTFSRSGKAYTLQAGYLPVGSYTFSAGIVSGNKSFSENGSFTVSALQAELTETIANHQLLKSLSEKTGGQFYVAADLMNISQDLKNKEDIKPVSYTQKRLDEVINIKLIFALVLGLLTAEWFMRKRSGGY